MIGQMDGIVNPKDIQKHRDAFRRVGPVTSIQKQLRQKQVTNSKHGAQMVPHCLVFPDNLGKRKITQKTTAVFAGKLKV